MQKRISPTQLVKGSKDVNKFRWPPRQQDLAEGVNEQGGEARGELRSRPRAVANQQRIQASKGEIDETLHVHLGAEAFDIGIARTASCTMEFGPPRFNLGKKRGNVTW